MPIAPEYFNNEIETHGYRVRNKTNADIVLAGGGTLPAGGLVPYTGAAQDVDLGNFKVQGRLTGSTQGNYVNIGYSSYSVSNVRRNPTSYGSWGVPTGAFVIEFPSNTNLHSQLNIKLPNSSWQSIFQELQIQTYSVGAAYSRAVLINNTGNPDVVTLVRFGISPSGKQCIVLNDVDAQWYYPQIVVDSYIGSSNVDAMGEWNSYMTTDLTGFSIATMGLSTALNKTIADATYAPANGGNYYSFDKLISQILGTVSNLDSALPNGGFISSYGSAGWGGSDAPIGGSYGGYIKFKGGPSNGLDFYYNLGHLTDLSRLWYRTKNSDGVKTWNELWTTNNFNPTTKSDVGHTHTSLINTNASDTIIDIHDIYEDYKFKFHHKAKYLDTNIFPGGTNNAGAILSIAKHQGGYGQLLGFREDGEIFTKNIYTGIFGSWKQFAFRDWVTGQGYITYTALVGYATEDWVNNKGYATQTYVNTAISNLVDSSPAALDTLNELAAALGDDPNFATTVTNQIATKEPAFSKNTAFNKNFGTTAGTVAEGSHAHGNITNDGKLGTARRVIITDASGFVTTSTISTDTLDLLSGLSGNVQTQLDGKASSSHNHAGVYIPTSHAANGITATHITNWNYAYSNSIKLNTVFDGDTGSFIGDNYIGDETGLLQENNTGFSIIAGTEYEYWKYGYNVTNGRRGINIHRGNGAIGLNKENDGSNGYAVDIAGIVHNDDFTVSQGYIHEGHNDPNKVLTSDGDAVGFSGQIEIIGGVIGMRIPVENPQPTDTVNNTSALFIIDGSNCVGDMFYIADNAIQGQTIKIYGSSSSSLPFDVEFINHAALTVHKDEMYEAVYVNTRWRITSHGFQML